MSEITYRLVKEEDYPIIKEMYVKLDAYFRTLNLRLPEPDDVEHVWLDSFVLTLGKFSQVHIAEMDGEAVGFMLSRVLRVPPYWGGVMVGTLSDMWIRKQARRRGVGDKLSRLGIEWLREQGVHSIEVQVLEDNSAIWKLYENMGFKPELHQIRLLWEDYLEEDDA